MPMSPGASTPLIARFQPGQLIALDAARAVTQQEFLHAVQALAERLPAASHIINLCQQRYHFLVTFCAILCRGSCNILPPNRNPATIEQIRAEYPLALCINDGPTLPGAGEIALEPLLAAIATAGPVAGPAMPQIPLDHCVAIAYTSGSTGKPKANAKSWRVLSGTADLLCQRFLPDSGNSLLVPTVPPQHMYGLETSIMMVLQGRITLYTGDTFYPEDIAAAFRTAGTGILVTTPVHLLTLAKSDVAIQGIARVICATAPLKPELAATIEQRFATVVEEIYGFTEAGSVATRQTTAGDAWQLLDGMQIHGTATALAVSGPQFSSAVPVLDVIEVLDQGRRFRLTGRAEDMVNVAGKRASLADLNYKLLGIPGIKDAVMMMPAEEDAIARPLALVVSRLDKRTILEQLARLVDPVFLPRPLILVDHIPRNETGKPQRLELLKIVEAHGQKNR